MSDEYGGLIVVFLLLLMFVLGMCAGTSTTNRKWENRVLEGKVTLQTQVITNVVIEADAK